MGFLWSFDMLFLVLTILKKISLFGIFSLMLLDQLKATSQFVQQVRNKSKKNGVWVLTARQHSG